MTGKQRKELTERRERRVMHVRKRVVGFPARPRLAVFRSHKHFAAQIIDDTQGRTLAAASTQQADLRAGAMHGGNIEAAKKVGQAIAERAKKAGVAAVVLDRRHYRYHGRVKAFADAAREGGLKF